MEIRATAGTATGFLCQVSWDAQNRSYARLLTEHDWEGCTGNPELNVETKGDLAEWALAFSSLGPFYTRLYDKWGMHHIFRDMTHTSQTAKRIYFQHGDVAIILRNAGTLSDDEEELETTRPLLALMEADAGRDERRTTATASDNNPWAAMSTTTATGTRWGDAGTTPPTPGSTGAEPATTRPAEDTRQAGSRHQPFAPPEGMPPGQRTEGPRQDVGAGLGHSGGPSSGHARRRSGRAMDIIESAVTVAEDAMKQSLAECETHMGEAFRAGMAQLCTAATDAGRIIGERRHSGATTKGGGYAEGRDRDSSDLHASRGASTGGGRSDSLRARDSRAGLQRRVPMVETLQGR